jgi:diguanylate cyclase (GGDEF)-like protein
MSSTQLSYAVAVVCLWLLIWCRWLNGRLSRMERQSRLDPLTGLGSGHWLNTERWPAALRSGRALTVCHIDLDHLKLRNDKFGLSFGDQLIRTAADALRDRLRHGVDEVFRLHTAGDEFVLLLSGPLADPQAFARSLLGRLRKRSVLASIGVSVTTETRFLPVRADLRVVAEKACKRAKRSGGDCAIVFVEATQDQADHAPFRLIAHDPPMPPQSQRAEPATDHALSATPHAVDTDCIPQPVQEDAPTQAHNPTQQGQLLAQLSIPLGTAEETVTAKISLAAGCAA